MQQYKKHAAKYRRALCQYNKSPLKKLKKPIAVRLLQARRAVS
jgi:hypothetical protein